MELKEKYTIEDLRAILIRLREPDGCPWDREQTHQSIKKSLIEETYEAIDALDTGDDKAFANELGDVLLQVVFHARLAEERGAFDFDDVVTEICTKLITRHTHVFGGDHAGTVEESLNTWEKNKKKEKRLESCSDALKDVPKYLPALMRTEKIQKKARGFGFDWADIDGAYDKVLEEAAELMDAQRNGTPEHIREEYGDLLFSVANLGRFLDTDPETALAAATDKFVSRFDKMERAARESGRELTELSAKEMDKLWNRAKNQKN